MECNSEAGITVGLIDSLICISRVIVDRDLSSPEVQEAIKDLRATDAMKQVMNIGDLESAKQYIEDQRKSINVLTNALELANSILKNNT